MNIRLLALAAGLALAVTGCCHYRGAVYSEYCMVGLDVRANAVSSSPVQASFGYDRGLGTFVPRRSSGTNGSPGEAVSVISWNHINSTLDPWRPTNTVLAVNAGFITGTAASVAAAPSNATVVIRGVDQTPMAELQTVGDPGERINAAVSAGRYLEAVKNKTQELLQYLTAPDGSLDRARLKALARGTSIEAIVNQQADSLEVKGLRQQLDGNWSWNVDDLYKNLPKPGK